MNRMNQHHQQYLPGPPRHENYVLAPPVASQDNRTFTQKLHADGKGIMRLADIAELHKLHLLVKAQEETEELLLFYKLTERLS